MALCVVVDCDVFDAGMRLKCRMSRRSHVNFRKIPPRAPLSIEVRSTDRILGYLHCMSHIGVAQLKVLS